mgnify:FL=1
MKKIKKFLLTIAMTMIFSVSAFAASGFEFILNVPFGINFSIPNKAAKDFSLGMQAGGDVGVMVQLGYMISVKDGFGISILGELGYSWDSYAFATEGGNSFIIRNNFNSFQVGLLPKFNIGLGGRHGLAVGIGGGVKIPLSGTLFAGYSVIDAVKIFNDEKVNRTDISDLFSPSVIGYIKATFDYSFFFTDKIAMNFGLYLGYDFGMKIKNLTLGGNGIGGGAFNLGLQLGFRFGPKA